MTAEEFWKGPPELARAYRGKAELEKRQFSERAWLQGLYFYDALSAIKAQALSSSAREAQKYTYAQEPYPYTDEDRRRRREEEAEKAREHAIAQFNLMKAAWDSTHG